MQSILIVEDEKRVADLLKTGLEENGYRVTVAYDGAMGLRLFRAQPFQLVVSDVVLPRMDGFELCREIRRIHAGVPILMLTALGTTDDKLDGFDAGADDYLIKPFAFEELLARLRVLLRKPQGGKTTVLRVGELELHLDTRQVFRQGQEVRLSSKEFSLLRYMMQNAGIVLSREKLEQHVWDYGYSGGSNVIDVYIRYLRKKLDQGHPVKYIHTVRGAGYVLKEGEG